METKKEIISNLLRAGHISLEQVVVLLTNDELLVRYTPRCPPSYPLPDPIEPYYGDGYNITCKKD